MGQNSADLLVSRHNVRSLLQDNAWISGMLRSLQFFNKICNCLGNLLKQFHGYQEVLNLCHFIDLHCKVAVMFIFV